MVCMYVLLSSVPPFREKKYTTQTAHTFDTYATRPSSSFPNTTDAFVVRGPSLFSHPRALAYKKKKTKRTKRDTKRKASEALEKTK